MAFSELEKLYRLIENMPDFCRVEKLAETKTRGHNFPIYGIVLGSENKNLPTFGLFGGVHGLEKIGSHIIINHLKYLTKQAQWDESLFRLFKQSRLVTIPIVNPGGMFLSRRSNPNGVDLMRNSPIDAEVSAWNMLAGQNISRKLPWFRGLPYSTMEIETKALIDFVKREMFSATFAMSLDIHSGFGMRDRLWYPFSSSHKIFPFKPKIENILQKFHESMPYNKYVIEPQSNAYLIHGDAWDYLFFEHYKQNTSKKSAENTQENSNKKSALTAINHQTRVYIPWTLELGSWTWVKKNPLQAFNAKGYFNPILPHRYDRVMRRHRCVLDLFQKLTAFHGRW